MPLNASTLASSLRDSWLPADGGPFPGSATESGGAFAGAVSGWFAEATAASFPCSTAAARRAQLAGGAGAAFGAGQAATAGVQLATALTAYLAGQVFGAGVASAPVGAAAAQAAFTGVFGDLDAATPDRADRVAQGTFALVRTTIVIFPPVVSPPAPVM